MTRLFSFAFWVFLVFGTAADVVAGNRVQSVGPVTGPSFDFTRVRVSEVVQVLYRDVLKTPYIIVPEVLGDTREVSMRFEAGGGGRLDRDIAGLLDSLGLSVVRQHGFDVVGVKKVAEPAPEVMEVFTYWPRFRDSGYLLELCRSLFKGQFAGIRSVSAAPGHGGSGSVPPDSAAALVDRSVDALVFSGTRVEVVALEKLLHQLDVRQGEVMVRGVVYEVGASDKEGSAFSLALRLLGGKLSLSAGAANVLENSVRFKSMSIDAVASALSSDSRFKVVSSPSLRVRSGGAGRFAVGQEVPVLGAVTFPGGGQAPVQSVEYRSSGVIFDLQPVVRESVVDLTVMQQLSSFVATETGVNGSPTLIKREVRTALSVADGDIVVLGGLAEDKDSGGRNGLSFVPDFLHSRSRENSRSEILLVLQVTRL